MLRKDHTEFLKRLHESRWKGAVIETGLGVPFANACTRVPGASKTLLFAACPYSKQAQPDIGLPSISQEMVGQAASDAWAALSLNWSDIPVEDRFVLAVTGAHKDFEARGSSHGWICIKTYVGDHYMHFTLPKIRQLNRQWAIDRTLNLVLEFLEDVLQKPRADLSTFSENVDVYDTPSTTVWDHIQLVNSTNPLVYHNGRFHRAISYLRKYNKIFRGSFNPPHHGHLAMGGKNCLYEVSLDNARKGSVDLTDLCHRIKMLDAAGVPSLITAGRATFVAFQEMLNYLGLEEKITYIVGMDTMKAVVSDKFVPNEEFLEPLQAAQFEVFAREGFGDSLHKRADALNYVVRRDVGDQSSTAIRQDPAGNKDMIPEAVADYIKLHDLYLQPSR